MKNLYQGQGEEVVSHSMSPAAEAWKLLFGFDLFISSLLKQIDKHLFGP